MAQPNIIAYAMLLAWPFVAWQLYRRLDPARALIWTILAGYLILPPATKFDFPVVPDFDKDSLPVLLALALSIFLLRDRIGFLPAGRLGKALILMFVLSPFVTVLANADPIPVRQGQDIPGMRVYDSVAAVANHVIYALPLFLGRRYLATPQAARALLAALVAAGLAYSLPMLVESRLSPQMNVWVYGFFQHDFFQTIRQGGYRPVVFLPHGLWVAMFTLICLAASAVFLRMGPAEARPKQLAVFLYLLLMLVVCKSAGVLVYAFAMLPLILFAPRRWQVLAAALVAVVVMTYPLLRGAHLVPLDAILDQARSLSPDRAWSLQFRIENEEILLARAGERPWFGWGGYARNFVHDPVTGEMTNIADGAWVIQIGTYGWLGYLAEFGLLCLPLWLLGREALVQRSTAFPPEVAGLALIFAFNMLDLLPNGTLVPLSWLIAGALLGHAEALRAARKAARPKAPPVQAVIRC
ncbi:hypothetical protein G5B31_00740 [Rhodobacter sp. SGA-6-6]|uniref:hypothetical protein n=1 Tax=Rhodobacter sp. SGA-6-6 TaxID=2710882 RepID=UPI0013E9B2E4|nr:hypothetical protein [Rhodobacter sp. SGA-6-6]